MFQPQKAFFKT